MPLERVARLRPQMVRMPRLRLPHPRVPDVCVCSTRPRKTSPSISRSRPGWARSPSRQSTPAGVQHALAPSRIATLHGRRSGVLSSGRPHQSGASGAHKRRPAHRRRASGARAAEWPPCLGRSQATAPLDAVSVRRVQATLFGRLLFRAQFPDPPAFPTELGSRACPSLRSPTGPFAVGTATPCARSLGGEGWSAPPRTSSASGR